MKPGDWISAQEAQLRLKVRPQTLYAYVSRGYLRVRAHPADSRRSLYNAADIDDLAIRKGASRKRSDVASAAIAWGEPVLSSAITTVRGGRLYYRGQDAVRLAQDQTLEAVAHLLLGAEVHPAPDDRPRSPAAEGGYRSRLYQALAARAASAPPLLGSSAAMIAAEAAVLLGMVADAVTGPGLAGPIHARLASGWSLDPDSRAADLIRRMLVLLADHELNASTFAARVTAGTGASLSASVLAGLSALSGPRHGEHGAMVRRFILDAQLHGAAEAIRGRLSEGRQLPGFGHPLYPQGDIRAAALLAEIATPDPMAQIQAAVKDLTDLEPNIDFALVAACEACGLPQDAPFALFATARCAGWIAHAVEQNGTGQLIRPRARYVGPEPVMA